MKFNKRVGVFHESLSFVNILLRFLSIFMYFHAFKTIALMSSQCAMSMFDSKDVSLSYKLPSNSINYVLILPFGMRNNVHVIIIMNLSRVTLQIELSTQHNEELCYYTT